MTENTLSSRAALRERAATIRDQGYAVDREEAIVGMYGVAAPVFDRNENEILGAISLYTAADQDIDHFLDENLNPLQRAANTIELELAYG